MAALRLISQAARRVPRNVQVLRRGYAEVSDKIGLSLVLPHQVRSRWRIDARMVVLIVFCLTLGLVRLGRGCAGEHCGGNR